MDVKVASFYGELEEEIYMKQPESFAIHGQENMVCKLDNYLYGLKLTPEEWHEKIWHSNVIE